MIAVFYGGELVWRERDRKLNEIIDSTAGAELGDDRARRSSRSSSCCWSSTSPRMLTGLVYQLVEGARAARHSRNISAGSSSRRAIDGLLIAVLAVFVQVLSPNKYVGWGIMFVWFVGTIFLNNMGYSNPLYTYAALAQRAAQRLRRRRQLLDRRGGRCNSTGCASRSSSRCSRICCGRAGPTSALGVRLQRMRRHASRDAARDRRRRRGRDGRDRRLRLSQHQAAQPLPDLRRGREISAPTTSANISNMRSCRGRRSPRSRSTSQLFPKERRLIANGRYDLSNETNAPIRDVHVRQGDRDVEFLKLDLAGARLVSRRQEVRLSHLPLRHSRSRRARRRR